MVLLGGHLRHSAANLIELLVAPTSCLLNDIFQDDSGNNLAFRLVDALVVDGVVRIESI